MNTCPRELPRVGRRRRSRRLRKKLRVGEFRELGFALALRLAPCVQADADDAFWDAFIVDCIERLGLSFGGAATGFVVRAGRGSVSAADQEAVRDWLATRPEIAGFELGALEDVWHAPPDVTTERPEP